MNRLGSILRIVAAGVQRRILRKWVRISASLPRRLRGFAAGIMRGRAMPFCKYKVAPRLGMRAVQRRLQLRLKNIEPRSTGEFETATET